MAEHLTPIEMPERIEHWIQFEWLLTANDEARMTNDKRAIVWQFVIQISSFVIILP
jgi:hypothetical protein